MKAINLEGRDRQISVSSRSRLHSEFQDSQSKQKYNNMNKNESNKLDLGE